MANHAKDLGVPIHPDAVVAVYYRADGEPLQAERIDGAIRAARTTIIPIPISDPEQGLLGCPGGSVPIRLADGSIKCVGP